MLLLSSADFFKISFSRKIPSGTLSGCQSVWVQIRTDILSVLIWVQTVCNGYQQKTKALTSKELVEKTIENVVPNSFVHMMKLFNYFG